MTEIYRSPKFNLDGYSAFTVKFADGTRKTVLEHRELVELHLGRTLSSNETVHHKDEDRGNNLLSNLEVMSRSAHGKLHSSCADTSLVCKACGVSFTRKARFERRRVKLGRDGPFCGKRCVGKVHH